MKSGRLSTEASFEDKERVVRDNLPFDLIQKLDALQNRDPRAYADFIEQDYPNHQSLEQLWEQEWEQYVEAHGTSQQINTLLALKETDKKKYNVKLWNIYQGLVNREG